MISGCLRAAQLQESYRFCYLLELQLILPAVEIIFLTACETWDVIRTLCLETSSEINHSLQKKNSKLLPNTPPKKKKLG